MAEKTVTVDLGRLRTLADRVARSANVLPTFTFPDVDRLPGSMVATVTDPVRIAARVDGAVASMREWADTARKSADAFELTDRTNAARIAGS